ncbi:N-acetylmuramoyl-L-alanine amidase [Rhodocaloribacter litoris]|uniref:N-acetylmuramoyl-L-alanine amidase family protein n=1 Tax=Rhodocaloribacter litoris TaxID=2558931 RepID=UPI00141F462D|nr:N-acetylmuramoyl-L-alanine amidase [Rhodocaloribacter litoris]QXD15083.1 N-acetylmuramoyl-L-alanine amidase [Rhodocaloribacter litoris]
MATVAESGKKVRQNILRGVYEDNLRTVRRLGPEPRTGAVPRRRAAPRMAGGLVWLLGLVVLVGGLLSMGGDPARSSEAGAGEGTVRMTLGLSAVPEQPARAGAVPTPELVANPTVARLYGLEPKTIVIDPGHGGYDPGTTGQSGLTEKEITLDVAHRLRARLSRYPGYRILLTREFDEKKTLRERITFANENKADLFISIHVNWVPDASLVPIETYYYGPGSDAKATRLAQRENRNSGYTLAEFNELTRQLGLEMKIQESRALAGSIQSVLYRNMRRINEHASDWGAKTGDFMVLLGVQAPSVLVEITSLSNREEEAKLGTSAHREELAMFLEQGIVGYLLPAANENEPTEHAAEEKD